MFQLTFLHTSHLRVIVKMLSSKLLHAFYNFNSFDDSQRRTYEIVCIHLRRLDATCHSKIKYINVNNNMLVSYLYLFKHLCIFLSKDAPSPNINR